MTCLAALTSHTPVQFAGLEWLDDDRILATHQAIFAVALIHVVRVVRERLGKGYARPVLGLRRDDFPGFNPDVQQVDLIIPDRLVCFGW